MDGVWWMVYTFYYLNPNSCIIHECGFYLGSFCPGGFCPGVGQIVSIHDYTQMSDQFLIPATNLVLGDAFDLGAT